MAGPQGYKINLEDYFFETYTQETDPSKMVIDPETGEPRLEKKNIKVYMKVSLPLMLCNSTMGAKDGRPDDDFDLIELGAIAKRIENAGPFITLDQKDYEVLRVRIKRIQRHLNYKFYEMLRRIIEAEKVELTEKCAENSKT